MTRLISAILTFSIIFIPTNSYSNPKVAEIKQGQKAPYNGILYNYEANAVLLASKEKGQLECSLQLRHSASKEKAKCDMLTSTVRASLSATEKKYSAILKIKNGQIEHLQKITLERPNSHKHWWFSGGFVAGVALSLGIFYVAVKTAK
tara:strand:- start:1326 stop:1769 length:444 start_codon:yes stop_codon:yes gene_type:complete